MANNNTLQKQDGFKSQFGFIMAAVGSCVGMANVWRFPMLVSRYGGLTFLIPYFIFAFIICQSGMMEEFSLGRWAKSGPSGAFGKAMGGASGGYTVSKKEVVDLLRQKSRPYLFSNSLAPAICAATIETINMLNESTALRDKVHENANYFRAGMEKLGFDLLPGEHPIVPVMLYDPKVANEFAARMLDKGVYVVGFCYPVVPKGRDRVRTQISAGHAKEDLDFAIQCFGEVKKEMGI